MLSLPSRLLPSSWASGSIPAANSLVCASELLLSRSLYRSPKKPRRAHIKSPSGTPRPIPILADGLRLEDDEVEDGDDDELEDEPSKPVALDNEGDLDAELVRILEAELA